MFVCLFVLSGYTVLTFVVVGNNQLHATYRAKNLDDAFVIRLICLLLCRVLAPTLDFRFDLFTWFGFLKKGVWDFCNIRLGYLLLKTNWLYLMTVNDIFLLIR